MTKTFDSGGYSQFKNQQDMKVAIDQIDKGFDAAKKVFDMDQVSRVLAMCAVIKHKDSYPNNTFFYNSIVAKETSTVDNAGIRFKMIPSGIDATFLPNDDSNSNPLQVKNEGFSADGGRSPTKLTYLINDKTANAALRKMCQDCTDDFSKMLNGVDDYLNYIERMKTVLKKTSIWTPDLEGKIGALAAFLKTIPDGMKEVVIQ